MQDKYMKILCPMLYFTLMFYAGYNYLSRKRSKIEIIPPKPVVTLNTNRYALLIIDMQKHYLKYINPKESSKEIPNQINLIRYAKQKGIPVYIIEDEEQNPTIKKILEELNNPITIRKPYGSGFHGTNLNEFLKNTNRTHLILMGGYASNCIRLTAQDTLDLGYTFITSPEIISDICRETMVKKKKMQKNYLNYQMCNLSYKNKNKKQKNQ